MCPPPRTPVTPCCLTPGNPAKAASTAFTHRALLAPPDGRAVNCVTLSQVRFASHVIDELPPSVPGSEAQLLLRPRRILTSRQFFVLFGLISVPVAAVSGYGFALGNAYAPWFALLDLVIVAVALRGVWQSGDRYERIVVGEQRLEVRRSPDDAAVFQAHPYWVRLRTEGVRDAPDHLRLGSQGREVEIGSFLPPCERSELAERLRWMLAAASGRAPANEH